MSNFNKSDRNIGKILLIILAVVMALTAVAGVVLGIVNLTRENKTDTIMTDVGNATENNKYPTQWYGDESYRYRLLSDTEMEIESKRVITGTVQPNVKYYSTESGELRAVYINAKTRVQYKMVYTYSVKCEYEMTIVDGRETYSCKNVYFPGIDEVPEIKMSYEMSESYNSTPMETDITNMIRYSAATNSMSDHVDISTKNFQRFPKLHQEVHVVLYDENYMACDEITIMN